MSPHPTRRSRTRRFLAPALTPALVVALVALLVGACAPAFDPTGACTVDGAVSGAYPELEAVIPKTFRGVAPKQVDSGRTCTPAGLSTLASHGISELRFAGAAWETGNDSGISLAVFTTQIGPPLEPEWLAEFYETGARGGKNVQSVETVTYALGDLLTGRRIDVLNGESFQTIVVWRRQGRVAVALVANFIRDIKTREAHDAVVNEAVDAFGG